MSNSRIVIGLDDLELEKPQKEPLVVRLDDTVPKQVSNTIGAGVATNRQTNHSTSYPPRPNENLHPMPSQQSGYPRERQLNSDNSFGKRRGEMPQQQKRKGWGTGICLFLTAIIFIAVFVWAAGFNRSITGRPMLGFVGWAGLLVLIPLIWRRR